MSQIAKGKFSNTLINLHHTVWNVRSEQSDVRSTVLNVRHTVCDRDSEAFP